jgi:hypothetical protein
MVAHHVLGEGLDLLVTGFLLRLLGGIDVDNVGGIGDMRDLRIGWLGTLREEAFTICSSSLLASAALSAFVILWSPLRPDMAHDPRRSGREESSPEGRYRDRSGEVTASSRPDTPVETPAERPHLIFRLSV